MKAPSFSSRRICVPGDLRKIQAVDSSNLTVPDGMATFQFQYTSRDLDGDPVPSTGFIAFPFALPANESQFPLIAEQSGVYILPDCLYRNIPLVHHNISEQG